ncbi:hypothetical protein TB1_034754 [Malus domestica]
MITFSKIEETPLSESREPDPQQDCFLKIEEASFSESREPDPRQVCNLHTQQQLSRYHKPLFQSALTELKHVKLAAPTTVL